MSRHQSPNNNSDNNKQSEAARRKLVRQVAKTLGLDESDFPHEISYNQLNIIQKNIRHVEPLKYAIKSLKIRITSDRDNLSKEVSKLSREKEHMQEEILNLQQENQALKSQIEDLGKLADNPTLALLFETMRQIFREELQNSEARSRSILDEKLNQISRAIQEGIRDMFLWQKSEIYQFFKHFFTKESGGDRRKVGQPLATNQTSGNVMNYPGLNKREIDCILLCLLKWWQGEKNSEMYQLGCWLSSALEKQGEERKMTLLEKNLVHKDDYNEAIRQLRNMIKRLESALQKQTDDAEYIIENLQEANDHFRNTLCRIKEYVIKNHGQEEWEKIEKYLEQQYSPNSDSGR